MRVEARLSWVRPWVCYRADSPPFSLQNPPPPGRLLGLITPAAGQLVNLISGPPFLVLVILGYFGTWAFLSSLSWHP